MYVPRKCKHLGYLVRKLDLVMCVYEIQAHVVWLQIQAHVVWLEIQAHVVWLEKTRDESSTARQRARAIATLKVCSNVSEH